VYTVYFFSRPLLATPDYASCACMRARHPFMTCTTKSPENCSKLHRPGDQSFVYTLYTRICVVFGNGAVRGNLTVSCYAARNRLRGRDANGRKRPVPSVIIVVVDAAAYETTCTCTFIFFNFFFLVNMTSVSGSMPRARIRSRNTRQRDRRAVDRYHDEQVVIGVIISRSKTTINDSVREKRDPVTTLVVHRRTDCASQPRGTYSVLRRCARSRRKPSTEKRSSSSCETSVREHQPETIKNVSPPGLSCPSSCRVSHSRSPFRTTFDARTA